MIRSGFVFLGTFIVGAVIALLARASMFDPQPNHTGHPPAGGDYAAMVSNSLAPASTAPDATKGGGAAAAPAPATNASGATPSAKDPHANHGASAPATPAAGQPVNTVCAICGMAVDPRIPTAEYQGKTIGFGCRNCPGKFQAEPDRYGPLYLNNETLKR